jgi:hypothetical protein
MPTCYVCAVLVCVYYCSSTVAQWEIYDTYMKEYSTALLEEDLEASRRADRLYAYYYIVCIHDDIQLWYCYIVCIHDDIKQAHSTVSALHMLLYTT